jgi:hypothetical protein
MTLLAASGLSPEGGNLQREKERREKGRKRE